MEGLIAAWDKSLVFLGPVIIAALFASFLLGHWLSRKGVGRGDAIDDGLSVVVGGLLALMSIVLAFNLGTATTRMEDRRTTALQEATAISTAMLQAAAVADPRGPAINGLLKEYTVARMEMMTKVPGSDQHAEAGGQVMHLQEEIWELMAALLAARAEVQTVNLSYALTQTFDMSTAQDFALASGLPPRLIWMLMISSSLAMGSLGLSYRGNRQEALWPDLGSCRRLEWCACHDPGPGYPPCRHH
jgi:hypothetical protein